MAEAYSDYSTRERRLATFTNWPLQNPSSYQMAESGFFDTGESGIVECYSCGVRIGSWMEGDNALNRHRIEAEVCPFMEGLEGDEDTRSTVPSLVPSSVPSSDSGVVGDMHMPRYQAEPAFTTRTLDLSKTRDVSQSELSPQSPPAKYKNPEERAKTFRGPGVHWPSPQKLHAQPDMLVKAGFFYIGPGDKVKCGYCGGKVKNWTQHQSPIDEHVKHFPQCSFVQNIEKQTKVLSEKIRAKSKSGQYRTSEQLQREHKEQREKSTRSKPRELVRKTLTKLHYTDEEIQTAETKVKRKGKHMNTSSLLQELQVMAKEQFGIRSDGQNPTDHVTCQVTDEEYEGNVQPHVEEDERVRKLKHEIKLAKEERDGMKNMMTCRICYSKPVDSLFLTCRHYVTCQECADKVKDCPICKQDIVGTVDVWMG